MATQLIKHLKKCAENDAIYSPLVYQWGFDEQLIAKALQNVSMYFPHYSCHDESHSRQILVHIERLLGENLTKLTATDTWLLLEAAYLHDIGMVVTDKQLSENFEAIKKHATSMKYTASGDSLIVIEATRNK
jgi:HD superfamily phosphodiesterase